MAQLRRLSALALLLACWSTSRAAAGQGITQPAGVGAAPGPWKVDIQMPLSEKIESTVVMQPTTVYKPSVELHTKGA